MCDVHVLIMIILLYSLKTGVAYHRISVAPWRRHLKAETCRGNFLSKIKSPYNALEHLLNIYTWLKNAKYNSHSYSSLGHFHTHRQEPDSRPWMQCNKWEYSHAAGPSRPRRIAGPSAQRAGLELDKSYAVAVLLLLQACGLSVSIGIRWPGTSDLCGVQHQTGNAHALCWPTAAVAGMYENLHVRSWIQTQQKASVCGGSGLTLGHAVV
jgi:hypothetical protein